MKHWKEIASFLLMTYVLNLFLLWIIPDRGFHYEILMTPGDKNVAFLLSPVSVWFIAMIHLIIILTRVVDWVSRNGVFR